MQSTGERIKDGKTARAHFNLFLALQTGLGRSLLPEESMLLPASASQRTAVQEPRRGPTFLQLNPGVCCATYKATLEFACQASEVAELSITCEREAFSQDPWVDYKPRQTGSSPASPRFDLRFGKSLHVPPSEGSRRVTR